MINTLNEAEAALNEAMRDFCADTGEPSADGVWFDLVVATALMIIDEGNHDLAREFCRTQVGSIPHDLEPWLGKKDWIK
jgi:hypothetical protein